MRKKFIRLAQSILVLLLLPSFSHAADDPITLKVAAFPAVDLIIKKSLPAWNKKYPHVKVKVVSRSFGDHHTALTAALATSSKMPDLIAIEYGYLGRFALGGGLENLLKPPYNAAQYRSKFIPFAYNQALSKKNGLTAIPSDIGPGALFYRKDLLDKAGVSVTDLTKSWESFIDSGVKIKKSTGAYLLAHARDIKDIVIRTDLKDGEGVYFDAKGKSLVGSAERFKKAFKLAKKVRTNNLDAKINAWSNEWGESFKRSNVATQMMGAWLAGHMSNWLAPKTSGLWRSSNLPQNSYASWGGTFLAIPRRSENKKLAWELIKHLTLNVEQQVQAFIDQDAFPALIEAGNSAYFNQPIEFLGGQKARLQWKETAQKISATAVFKHDAVAEEIVNSELDLVLNRGKAIDKALKDADRLIARRARR